MECPERVKGETYCVSSARAYLLFTPWSVNAKIPWWTMSPGGESSTRRFQRAGCAKRTGRLDDLFVAFYFYVSNGDASDTDHCASTRPVRVVPTSY